MRSFSRKFMAFSGQEATPELLFFSANSNGELEVLLHKFEKRESFHPFQGFHICTVVRWKGIF